MAVVILG